ncbi:MAG: hypothetical protein AAGF98_14390 [Cyanobacteria bacterium P01_H01_bin.153]
MDNSFPRSVQLHRLLLAIVITFLLADTYLPPKLSAGTVESIVQKVITLIQSTQPE